MLLKNKDNQNEIYEGAGVTVAEELKGLVDELNRDKSSGCFEIALYLVKRFNIKTIGDREREIFIYKDGLYMKGTNHIKKWLHELFFNLNALCLRIIINWNLDYYPMTQNFFFYIKFQLIIILRQSAFKLKNFSTMY